LCDSPIPFILIVVEKVLQESNRISKSSLMDSRKLHYSLEYLTCAGIGFPIEFRLAIQSSLALLKKENQFKYAQFIGRINGTQNDYYLSCGIGVDYILDRTYFYSKDNCVTWTQMPSVQQIAMEIGTTVKGNFTGDPTTDAETEMALNNADEIEDGDEWTSIKEEERLAATVSAMTLDGAIAPRGAVIAEPAGMAEENPKFIGLEKTEATQLHAYYHIRDPIFPWDKNITCRADYNIVMDFLDSIAHDLPKGCWCIEIDPSETVSIIRSLFWPGLIGFHVLGTAEFGWMYMGNGRKNWDVPFMISPPPAVLRASLRDDEVADYVESDSDDEEELSNEVIALGAIVSAFGEWGKPDDPARKKNMTLDKGCVKVVSRYN